jgi:hypothetical protein
MRQIIQAIDNQQDLEGFVNASARGMESQPPEPRYERHPVGYRLMLGLIT